MMLPLQDITSDITEQKDEGYPNLPIEQIHGRHNNNTYVTNIKSSERRLEISRGKYRNWLRKASRLKTKN